MNKYANTKKSKKFILILILLILFNFLYPKNSFADTIIGGDSIKEEASGRYTTDDSEDKGGFFDIGTNFTKLLFLGERAILGLLNNIFCDDNNEFVYAKEGDAIKVQLKLTPESIIKGKFILFNANIFEEIDTNGNSEYYDGGAGKEGTQTGRKELRGTIAGWYYALRNLAIVALLSVLVYVGIRMITSTISQDKAKYKMMFKDWLIALCLLIIMHYIMIAILNISTDIVNAIGTSGSAGSQTEVLMQKIGTITESERSYTITYNGKEYTDIRAVYIDENDKLEFYDIGNALAYMLLLLVIIIYTVIFAVKYLKREFTIIFLVLLGPISCITYPIDKISDGKAQAFNKWFFEFLYNVIIQPFHLLIYVVLVGSATQLADDNLLYAIICFAVMIPAEKFIKEMFGFRDKLGSPLGAFAGGAVASQLFNKMKGGGSSSKKFNDGDNDSTPNKLPPKTKNDSDLVDGNTGNGPNSIGGAKDNEDVSQAKLGEGNSNNKDDVLEAYNSEGFGQNANGEYFNPWTDEYDPEYDPHNDSTYKKDTLDASEQADQAQGEKEFIRQLNDAKDEDDKEDNPIDKENEKTEEQEENRLKKIWNSKPVGTIRSVHNQRVSKKWGSTSRGQRWARRIGKGAKGIAKFAGRTALTGAGALALGTVGFMVGQGSKGALAGAALGNSLYKKGESLAGNAVNTGKDYVNAFRRDDGRFFSNESKAFNEFRADKKQLDKAVYSYRKNHDGQDPTRKQLQEEMSDRFELYRYGLSDEQIDDCLPIYQKKKNDLLKNPQMDENKAKEIAASQSKYTANLAKAYSPKDFMDSKVMNNAYDRITNGLMENTGCDYIMADKYAKQYLIDAAAMKSVSAKEIALPDKTITVRNVTNTNNSSTQMNLKVKEGKTKVNYEGKKDSAVDKVNVSIDFVENQDNLKEIGNIGKSDKGRKVDIDIKDKETKGKIEKVKQERVSKAELSGEKNAAEDRVKKMRLEETIAKNHNVEATKGKLQNEVNNMIKQIGDSSNNSNKK